MNGEYSNVSVFVVLERVVAVQNLERDPQLSRCMVELLCVCSRTKDMSPKSTTQPLGGQGQGAGLQTCLIGGVGGGSKLQGLVSSCRNGGCCCAECLRTGSRACQPVRTWDIPGYFFDGWYLEQCNCKHYNQGITGSCRQKNRRGCWRVLRSWWRPPVRPAPVWRPAVHCGAA